MPDSKEAVTLFLCTEIRAAAAAAAGAAAFPPERQPHTLPIDTAEAPLLLQRPSLSRLSHAYKETETEGDREKDEK